MRRYRLIALRTAAMLAVGFVVLRVVYRVIFGGGSGGGLVLLDLPTVPLAGPFSGIFLFGAVTTGGIATAALSALPFAALILALGLVGVVVDLRALLVRGSNRGPLRTVSRALVIALSAFPALRDAVVRVRVARELRGERSLASLLVPVLEQTVERAIELGASMEVRGFAATRHPQVDPSRPVVVTDAALGFDDGWILDPVDLTLDPGTLTLVTGATGSGKSTLLAAMSGLFQHLWEGQQEGRIAVGGLDRQTTPPRETAGFVGVVPQAVRLSFVAGTVFEEIGFASATRGESADLVAARVGEVASQLAIGHLFERPVTALSAGEACLVAVAGAVVSRPGLLLLDEPLADLDSAARERVVAVLAHLAHAQGMCVVVAEHAPEHWGDLPDRRLELREGTVRIAVGAPAGRRDGAAPRLGAHDAVGAGRGGSSAPIARIRELSVSHGAKVAVDGASFDLRAGESAALVGPNGAGKSTLLLDLARPHAKNTVRVDALDVATLSRTARRGAIALVPEAFDDLLFATTVAEECARADLRAAVRGTAAGFFALLGIDDPAAAAESRALLDHHPRDLSAGQRLCLVIAIQLSARPRVLLIDEPTRGLDASARSLVGGALLMAAAEGTAVLFATHDRGFAERYAERMITMVGGRVAETADAVAR